MTSRTLVGSVTVERGRAGHLYGSPATSRSSPIGRPVSGRDYFGPDWYDRLRADLLDWLAATDDPLADGCLPLSTRERARWRPDDGPDGTL